MRAVEAGAVVLFASLMLPTAGRVDARQPGCAGGAQ